MTNEQFQSSVDRAWARLHVPASIMWRCPKCDGAQLVIRGTVAVCFGVTETMQ